MPDVWTFINGIGGGVQAIQEAHAKRMEQDLEIAKTRAQLGDFSGFDTLAEKYPDRFGGEGMQTTVSYLKTEQAKKQKLDGLKQDLDMFKTKFAGQIDAYDDAMARAKTSGDYSDVRTALGSSPEMLQHYGGFYPKDNKPLMAANKAKVEATEALIDNRVANTGLTKVKTGLAPQETQIRWINANRPRSGRSSSGAVTMVYQANEDGMPIDANGNVLTQIPKGSKIIRGKDASGGWVSVTTKTYDDEGNETSRTEKSFKGGKGRGKTITPANPPKNPKPQKPKAGNSTVGLF